MTLTLSNTYHQKRVITFDVETTTKNKGHPFTESNKPVSIHVKVNNEPTKAFFLEDFGKAIDILKTGDIFVGFNIKFDIHWLRRTFNFVPKAVWDCQLGEFLFSAQTNAYPALNDAAKAYNLPLKHDKVKEYWDNDVDTDQIPREILEEYGNYDVDLTYNVFQKQLKLFESDKSHMYKLFRLHCNDLFVL